MKKQTVIFILLVLLLVIFNNVLVGEFHSSTNLLGKNQLLSTEHVAPQKLFDKTWKTIKTKYIDASLNHQKWDRWKKHYKGKINTDEDANVAINTMLESLDDPYSRYLNKASYAEQNVSINSKISGIGANITAIKGSTYIMSVVEDSPAKAAKLQRGDLILKVNGKDVKGMKTAEVVNLVRGPENTAVKLTIKREGKILQKKLIRKEIKIKTVESAVDKNIGYIRIISFIGETTPVEFINALEKTKNTKGLIIDLRENTGGLLPNAVFIANVFIDKGPLVSIVDRNGYKTNIYARENDYTINKPLIILVNGDSASASEIFSGALKDYHKAKLLGTKTFGKGMVQKIFPMPNETGLNLTIAKYLTPSGHDINKKGIAPDIEINENRQDFLKRNDVQLKQAKKVLAKLIKEKN